MHNEQLLIIFDRAFDSKQHTKCIVHMSMNLKHINTKQDFIK